jgi:hypothetical protein
MEKEILKHSRKIISISKKPNQSFFKKATETVIEIFIIVFAVSFSIWLHGLREHYREQKEVRIFLINIKEDLKQDISWLKSDVEEYKKENDKLTGILKLTSKKSEDLNGKNIDVSFPMYLFMNKINNGNFEGFKSSGKIGYIENEELKKAILHYYQQDALKIVEMNGLFNQYQIKTLDSFDNISDDNKIGQKLQSKIEFLQLLAVTNYRFCNNTLIKNATDLISAIDLELNK